MVSELFPILQTYGEQPPSIQLKWTGSLSSTVIQEFLLRSLLESSHFRSFPPSMRFQRSFWRWVIDKLEEAEEEVDERIYDRYLQLLPTAKLGHLSMHSPPPPAYVTHIWIDNTNLNHHDPLNIGEPSNYNFVTVLDAQTTIESGTTGLRTWPASLLLAEVLISQPDLIKARCLELGSGVGFLGAVVAKLQGSESSLWLTDCNEEVLKRCKENVYLPCNGLSSHRTINFRMLDWEAALDDDRRAGVVQLLEEADPEVIFGADIVYDTGLIPSLVAVLRLALSPDQRHSNRQVYLALTVRNEATVSAFVEEAAREFLVTELTPTIEPKFFLVLPRSTGSTEIGGEQVRLYNIKNHCQQGRIHELSTNTHDYT